MSADKRTPILVTGASGYVASWIVKYLLEEGYKVRGTVRSTKAFAKIEHLKKMEEDHPGKLKLMEADLLKEGSFDEAAHGCKIVIHTASPFFIQKIKDAKSQLIDPAVKGTKNVLNAVNKSGSVERVVLTSSCAAIYGDNADMELLEEGESFTEEIWNTSSSIAHNPYSYSKTIAEKTGWEMSKESGKWSFTTINPGFIMGPSLSNRQDGTSVKNMIELMSGRFKSGAPDLHFAVVDVRDVARAHIKAALINEASGRHICVSDHATFLDFADCLREEYPNNKLPKKLAPKFLMYIIGPLLGVNWRFINRNIGFKLKFDNSYIKTDLNMEFLPFKKTILDHAQQLVDSGLVEKK
jgi:nucleoside-diphosphate-sugar epimerase